MNPLYDEIGKSYDATRKADPEITRHLRNHLQVPKGTKVLDIACGTGNYSIALEQSGLYVTGCDISTEMIEIAKQKSSKINWELADINCLPYENKTFTGVSCILSIHHFGELFVPFQEVFRVMDRGRFVIFTSSPEQMNTYWLKEYFPQAIEASSKQMPDLTTVNNTLQAVGFDIIGHETFLIQPDLEDFFLYSGKYEPHIYLDETVRAGISTFANLATKEEIVLGCSKLKRDIETKKINEVLPRYSSVKGDYVFVVAEKKK
ncbi:class I SAM-dependent methyltransferase [Pseudalkalibacillus salsuginis]|uniref:class I SAM-dependent methyltransferase n=1 Tax=Pseudalkalibacillus salsuginis TaxID=2910972 RepID=UPI001F32BC0B|nr:methyltransferase domain-containing protein [Pseudalkalibacillus salsuginis]MCF6409468.1 methyltransferase domain-containing protein [Pseudalkalibacillus salsuginis]